MKAFAPTPTVLFRHITRGYDALKDWRDLAELFRVELLNTDRKKRYVNLIAEMMQAVGASLTIPSVKSRVRARSVVDSLSAEVISLVCDDDIEEMQLPELLEDCANEVMFAPIAVVAVGRHAGERAVEIEGEPMSLQEPFGRLVPLEDLSIDPDAGVWKSKEFVARRVTIRKGAVVGMLPFGIDPAPEVDPMNPGAVLAPTAQNAPPVPVMTRQEAAEYIAQMHSREDKDSSLAEEDRGDVPDREDKSDLVNLWHAAVYYGNQVWECWIPDSDSQPDKFLSCRRYDAPQSVPTPDGQMVEISPGHPRGPFEHVTFAPTRGSVLGLPGLLLIADLHEASRDLSAKLVRQLKKMKTVIGFRAAQAKEAEKIRTGEDFVMVQIDDPKSIITQKVGEADPQLPAAIEMLGAMFGNSGGGTRQLSGTEAAAQLATVASYMQGGAQMRMNRLRLRIQRLGSAIVEQVAFWRIFSDPAAYRTVDFPLGGGLMIPIVFDPAEMAADAMRFRFGIQAFTAPVFDPAMQAQRITQFLDFVAKARPYIMEGSMRPEALGEIGRVFYGIENTEALIGGMVPTGQLVAMAAMASAGAAPMQQQPAAPPGPANQNQRTNAVRSAMAPAVPQSPSGGR